MFVSSNVPALFKKGTLKLMPLEGGGYRRVAEATLVIEPFPVNLARELGEDITGHFVDDEGIIRPEFGAIDLRLRSGLQSVTVRPHEDIDPCALISPVSIKDVSVERIEDKKTQREWLALSFVLVFSLEDKESRNFVLDGFGRTWLWSFVAMQRELLDTAAIHEAAARLGEHGATSLSYASPDGTSGTVHFDKDTAKLSRAKARELREQAASERKH